MLLLMRINKAGPKRALPSRVNRQLWLRGGLSLAAYVACFNWAMHFTSAAHVALQIGASPVWALLWEWRSREQRHGSSLLAAGLALTGILVLFWPALNSGGTTVIGEALALGSGILWANYGIQCRSLGTHLTGTESSAHCMWRAGVLLLPLGFLETLWKPITWRADLISIQLYCVLFGAIVAFALWNNALRHWKTSEVYLFNNLIPLSTMFFAALLLEEPVTPRFGVSMLLVIAGVILGQARKMVARQTKDPKSVPLG